MKRLHRSGFTLVELLVTIMIISIVMAFAIGGMMAASSVARRDRTEAVIAKLDTQLMIRWESYHTRRLPIASTAGGTNRNTMAWTRLNAIRELMRLEMPQRYEDIVADVAVFPGTQITPTYLTSTGTPQLSLAYLRRYNGNATKPTELYQGAECLYMIVTMGLEDTSEGGELISERFIGDADGDGMPEFHDGWGNPVSFLRWAPGFISDRQPSHDALISPDPFDRLGIDRGTGRGYALFPLIYSGGPDEVQDIWAASLLTDAANYNNPYWAEGSDPLPGAAYDNDSDGDESGDIIHNHLIGSR